MIESIRIQDVATYGDTSDGHLTGLSEFNFLYGSNGSGKTTITRVIADESEFPACSVSWKGGTKLQPMVYNRDFVTKNFSPSVDIKGIFTLGENNLDTINKIKAAKLQLDAYTKKIESLNIALQGQDGAGGKKGELAAREEVFKNKCWAQKQKHDAKFSGAFEGYRNSSEKFKGKVLQERISKSAMSETLAVIEKKAEAIFGPTLTVEQSVPSIDTSRAIAHEFDAILKKRVIGKDDVDITAMIKKLGNSDWVREGRAFYDANGSLCPFCQQSTTDAFAQSLNEYFDETFETDSRAIDDLATNYATDTARLQQQIASIIATPSKFLDVEILKSEKELLDSKVTINIQRLALKKREPSQIVELESIDNVASTIKTLIDTSNSLIIDHNKLVSNLAQERRALTAQVWNYLIDVELKADLADYDMATNGLNKAINEMTAQIAVATTDKNIKAAELHALEKDTTSIQPTIDEINTLLLSFGFHSFLLAEASNGSSYKLIRQDGTDIKETLSEGEMSFITFLYFYHLLKGSNSDTGVITDRVVVFDDPVSSLDSDILFIVGSLIKRLFHEVRAGTGYIKQIFVLTHNVYFHKEVTFNPKNRHYGQNSATFWIVKKTGLKSKIQKCSTNPIKTSYQLLWEEVQKDDRTNLSIQNTLRRILESYFKILGGWDSDKICALFEGQEKWVCNSLFSWINDGSHSALDDIYASTDPSMVDNYLRVFRAIFERTKHLEHYKMMMGEAYEEIPAAIE
ncbi:MAG: AAA family ATPase [Pseudomonadota bacterium]